MVKELSKKELIENHWFSNNTLKYQPLFDSFGVSGLKDNA